jgi:hypothetical protein
VGYKKKVDLMNLGGALKTAAKDAIKGKESINADYNIVIPSFTKRALIRVEYFETDGLAVGDLAALGDLQGGGNIQEALFGSQLLLVTSSAGLGGDEPAPVPNAKKIQIGTLKYWVIAAVKL